MVNHECHDWRVFEAVPVGAVPVNLAVDGEQKPRRTGKQEEQEVLYLK